MSALHGTLLQPTYLGDNDKICPPILGSGTIKRAVVRRNARILDLLRKGGPHPLAGLDSLEALDQGAECGVCQEGASKDAGTRS